MSEHDYSNTIKADTTLAADFDTPAKMSLVLNSKLAARLYIDGLTAGAKAKYTVGNASDAHEITAVQGSKGVFFEIKDILPTQLMTDFKITYEGKAYTFKPLTWAYRVLNDSEVLAKNAAMANILYEYHHSAANQG